MSGALKLVLAVVTVAVLVLFLPIPMGSYDDGGTREYKALTYKIVAWNKLTSDAVYQNTSVYWYPDSNKSIGELWKLESGK